MQSAALPDRATSEGSLEVLLVTSRKRRRWILPKGKVAAGMLPHRSAAREAMEEAGVVGTPNDAPVGELVKRRRLTAARRSCAFTHCVSPARWSAGRRTGSGSDIGSLWSKHSSSSLITRSARFYVDLPV